MTMPGSGVKECHLAGRWYPAAAEQLADEVRGFLRAAPTGPLPGVRAIVVPHGAHRHSGAVAGRAFAAAGAAFRRAVVLGPSHYVSFHGAATLPMTGYRTPLGTIPIDEGGVNALLATPSVRPNLAVFLREHTLEVQLPFLQVALPSCALVALLVGRLTREDAEALAVTMRSLCTPDTLLVVSSDLVHYGRRFEFLPVPPTDAAAVAATVRQLDRMALDRLLARDAEGFARYEADTGAPICGRASIDVLLRTLPAGAQGHELAYSSLLEATGEFEHTVSYAAVAFTLDT